MNIDKLLDPLIRGIDFKNRGDDFDLEEELIIQGYQPGLHDLQDLLNAGGEINNIDDMAKIERLLAELKMKDERDRDGDPGNRSEFLDEQEAKNDEDLRLLLQEQERILKADQARKFK